MPVCMPGPHGAGSASCSAKSGSPSGPPSDGTPDLLPEAPLLLRLPVSPPLPVPVESPPSTELPASSAVRPAEDGWGPAHRTRPPARGPRRGSADGATLGGSPFQMASPRRSPSTHARASSPVASAAEPCENVLLVAHDSTRVRFAPSPTGLPPHRRRPHRALQLALGAEDRRHVRPAHRGHRPGAQHRRERARHPRLAEVARARLGRGARASAARTARTRRWSGSRIYKEYAERLIASGKAYRCYCTKEELDAQREALKASDPKAQFQLPGHVPRPQGPARPAVRRALQGARRAAAVTYVDKVFGEVTTPNAAQQDFVLLRSRRRAALQLRRRRRRHHDGDHARRARARSHGQHAAADPALRGVRRDGRRSSRTCR